MQNNKVKNIFFIEDDTENYKTGLYLEMEDWRKFANCSTDCVVPFKLIDDIPQKSSQLSSEIIQSEDKPIANEQGFWEAIMLLKDVRQYATDMTSHADSYEAQSAYKKYKKLLSILENKIFTI